MICIKTRFYVPSGGGGVKIFTLKGKNELIIKEKLKEQIKEWIEKLNLRYIMFEIERQIKGSKWILDTNELIPRSFGRKGMSYEEQIEFDKRIIEDNEKFLKFIKEEFNIKLNDSDRFIFFQELEKST